LAEEDNKTATDKTKRCNVGWKSVLKNKTRRWTTTCEIRKLKKHHRVTSLGAILQQDVTYNDVTSTCHEWRQSRHRDVIPCKSYIARTCHTHIH